MQYKFNQIPLVDDNSLDFEVIPGELLRIEISTSLANKRESIAKNITKEVLKVGFRDLSINKQKFFQQIFNPCSVGKYLSEVGEYTEKEIADFIQQLNQYNIDLKAEDKVNKLPSNLQRAILLKVQMKKDKLLVVDTSGMYLSLLVISYQLLNEFLNNGGTCIEITYPPLGGEELNTYIQSNIKVITL